MLINKNGISQYFRIICSFLVPKGSSFSSYHIIRQQACSPGGEMIWAPVHADTYCSYKSEPFAINLSHRHGGDSAAIKREKCTTEQERWEVRVKRLFLRDGFNRRHRAQTPSKPALSGFCRFIAETKQGVTSRKVSWINEGKLIKVFNAYLMLELAR